MNRERWNDGAENFSYGRLSIRRSQPPSLEPWENRIESCVKEDGKRGSGGEGKGKSPARREKSHGRRRIGGLVKFIRSGFRFEWNVRTLFYWSKKKKKRKGTFLEREDCEIIEGKLRSDEGDRRRRKRSNVRKKKKKNVEYQP